MGELMKNRSRGVFNKYIVDKKKEKKKKGSLQHLKNVY